MLNGGPLPESRHSPLRQEFLVFLGGFSTFAQ
jgi:hypothetical protein